MKTTYREEGDIFIIDIEGFLDFESQEPLKRELHSMAGKLQTKAIAKDIIFNFKNLQFVGSSGISSFIATLRQFNLACPIRPKYCNVGSEFQKIMRAFDHEALFDFVEDEATARRQPRIDS